MSSETGAKAGSEQHDDEALRDNIAGGAAELKIALSSPIPAATPPRPAEEIGQKEH